ncbi:MAG TPA: ABC transporter permease [Paludibaculum sp.]|jgi:predicted permease
MRFANIVRLRLRSLFSRTAVEQELDEELQYHLEREMEAHAAAGLSPEQARGKALASIAGYEQRKEECRDMRGLNLLDNLVQDIHFAIRQLRKNPGFTSTAIFMLALGMCAAVAIFAFVDAALLKPLPYRDSTRLVGVYETVPMFPRSNLSYHDYLDWKKLNTVFSSLDVYQRRGYLLRTAAGLQAARGARISDGFFRTLGVSPVVGRDFYAGEDLPSAAHTVMLSYGAWQKRYGGKNDVVGQTVELDGVSATIIGVLPSDFHFPLAEPAEFWTTMHATGDCDLRRSCHSLYGVARLKDGVSIDAALSNVQAIAKQLERQYPESNRNQGATLTMLSDVIVGDIRPILLVLLGGAGLLLLIAGVNIASLLLVRCESRRREIAVRSALGAGRVRLVRQFVTEGFVLVAAGSALGLTAAYWTIQALLKLIPADILARMTFLNGLGLNLRVMLFAAAISALALGLYAITPTLRLSLAEMREGLAEGSRGSAGVFWRRLGTKLVVVELATAVVLLVGAGLLGKSLYHLLRVNLGMQPERLATMSVAAPKSGYDKDEQAIVLARSVLSRLSTLPGVQSAGIASQLPVTSNGNTTWFRVVGRPHNGGHEEAPERQVSPTYFPTAGARLIRGRYFTESEDKSRPPVGIINQAMAARHFPNEDPVGKRIYYISHAQEPIEIVGLIENIKEGPLDTDIPPVLYIPFNRSPDRFFSVIVRTSQDEQSLLPTLTAAVRELDPDIVTTTATMRDRIDDSPSAYLHRSSAWLVGGFAALALLLSIVGLYGVVAYSVSQRTREIGVRMAMGAQPGSVYGLILKEAGWLTVLGLVFGLGCAIVAATLMKGLLFGVRSWDLATLAAVAVVLGLASLMASFIPARRAASVNPVEALRSE